VRLSGQGLMGGGMYIPFEEVKWRDLSWVIRHHHSSPTRPAGLRMAAFAQDRVLVVGVEVRHSHPCQSGLHVFLLLGVNAVVTMGWRVGDRPLGGAIPAFAAVDGTEVGSKEGRALGCSGGADACHIEALLPDLAYHIARCASPAVLQCVPTGEPRAHTHTHTHTHTPVLRP
jgi:hypothetical protein